MKNCCLNRRTLTPLISLILGCSLQLIPAVFLHAAETGTIATDRPGFSFGTHTVAPGNFYVESGVQYSVNRSGPDSENYNLPQLQWRAGVTDRLELQLLWAGWNRDLMERGARNTSVSDLTLGGKARLHQSEHMNITLLGQLSIPAGTAPSTSDSTDPLLGLLFDRSLTGNLQFFANAIAARFEEGTEDVLEHRVTLGLGYSHNARWASFIEYYGAFPDVDSVEETSVVDGGFTYYPKPHIQIDFSVGFGLRDSSSDFVGIGFSYRY